MPRRGRARDRRRAGRAPRCSISGRLARARRRADVHRLPQPEGLHRARSWCGAARSRCRATRASASCATSSRPASPARPPSGGGSSTVDVSEDFRGPVSVVHRHVDAIRKLKVVLDGGNGMAGPMVGPILDAASARRRCRPTGRPTATSPTTSPTRCCPRTATFIIEKVLRRGRRPGHRLGRRRRPLLLHRRHRRVRRRRLPHRAAGGVDPRQGARARRSSTTCAPRARCATWSSAPAAAPT